MAFVQLEDLRGVTEALVFPRVYEKYQQLLAPEALVVLRGRLSVREEEAPKIIPEEVRALCHGDGCRPGRPGGGFARSADFGAYAPKPAAGFGMDGLPPALREEIAFREGNNRPDPRRLTLTLPGRGREEQAALLLMPTPGSIPVTFRLRDENREETAPATCGCGRTSTARGFRRSSARIRWR